MKLLNYTNKIISPNGKNNKIHLSQVSLIQINNYRSLRWFNKKLEMSSMIIMSWIVMISSHNFFINILNEYIRKNETL